MNRPASVQEWIHWLEEGRGARWIWRAATLLSLLVLSLWTAFKQFHGPADEMTLLQADVGRQLATGHGFTTLVNYPQTAAVMRARHGVQVDAAGFYPELYQAPLYSIVIAAGLRLLPGGVAGGAVCAAARAARTALPPIISCSASIWSLLWIAAWQTYLLGRRLFDDRVAGFEIILGIDKWLPAVSTFEVNQSQAKVICKDIIKLSTLPDDEFNTLISDFEIIIGSPPCVVLIRINREKLIRLKV